MMNQKFSQLNRDYAKKMASRDDVLIKRSTRKGLGWLLTGLLGTLFLLVGFYTVKKIAISTTKHVSKISQLTEKPKSFPVKHIKIKSGLHAKPEYGFYTMLPNMEVKSASHMEETEKHLKSVN
jgi:hypothetical protein